MKKKWSLLERIYISSVKISKWNCRQSISAGASQSSWSTSITSDESTRSLSSSTTEKKSNLSWPRGWWWYWSEGRRDGSGEIVWIDDDGSSWRVSIIDERLEAEVKDKTESCLGVSDAKSSCEKSKKVDFASGEEQNGSANWWKATWSELWGEQNDKKFLVPGDILHITREMYSTFHFAQIAWMGHLLLSRPQGENPPSQIQVKLDRPPLKMSSTFHQRKK